MADSAADAGARATGADADGGFAGSGRRRWCRRRSSAASYRVIANDRKFNRIVSFDWEKYDQGHVVYRPAQMSGDELRLGQSKTYETFYSLHSIASRFPMRGPRLRTQWLIYNTFMRRGSKTERINSIAAATPAPDTAPMPPILPVKREWRAAVLEATHGPGPPLG